jgi:hypothetical protein
LDKRSLSITALTPPSVMPGQSNIISAFRLLQGLHSFVSAIRNLSLTLVQLLMSSSSNNGHLRQRSPIGTRSAIPSVHTL